MSEPIVTVVVPTIAAGAALLDCILSLERQTLRGFEIVIVDNSGQGLARASTAARFGASIIEKERNVGFGAAINEAFRRSRAPYLATLNDDAVAGPRWLESLVAAMEARPDAGMCASQVRLADGGALDSAGMLIAGDGSSKQRGHREAPERYAQPAEVLLPSGCAALYRRRMLESVGLFDEDFFLYCEDTDLGLRARWAGWTCLYVPEAMVDHRYSRSAGQASPLKAYYVERNRLFVALKNFPGRRLWSVPWFACSRYLWHLFSLFEKQGSAAQFRREHGNPLRLVYIVARAHCALLFYGPRLWRRRRAIRRTARIRPEEFCRLLETHSISPRQVAAL